MFSLYVQNAKWNHFWNIIVIFRSLSIADSLYKKKEPVFCIFFADFSLCFVKFFVKYEIDEVFLFTYLFHFPIKQREGFLTKIEEAYKK